MKTKLKNLGESGDREKEKDAVRLTCDLCALKYCRRQFLITVLSKTLYFKRSWRPFAHFHMSTLFSPHSTLRYYILQTLLSDWQVYSHREKASSQFQSHTESKWERQLFKSKSPQLFWQVKGSTAAATTKKKNKWPSLTLFRVDQVSGTDSEQVAMIPSLPLLLIRRLQVIIRWRRGNLISISGGLIISEDEEDEAQEKLRHTFLAIKN